MIIPLILFIDCFHIDYYNFKVSYDEILIVNLKEMVKTKIYYGKIHNVYRV
jgi:hypothetical protein